MTLRRRLFDPVLLSMAGRTGWIVVRVIVEAAFSAASPRGCGDAGALKSSGRSSPRRARGLRVSNSVNRDKILWSETASPRAIGPRSETPQKSVMASFTLAPGVRGGEPFRGNADLFWAPRMLSGWSSTKKVSSLSEAITLQHPREHGGVRFSGPIVRGGKHVLANRAGLGREPLLAGARQSACRYW
jgi:hypothetical protein